RSLPRRPGPPECPRLSLPRFGIAAAPARRVGPTKKERPGRPQAACAWLASLPGHRPAGRRARLEEELRRELNLTRRSRVAGREACVADHSEGCAEGQGGPPRLTEV